MRQPILNLLKIESHDDKFISITKCLNSAPHRTPPVHPA